MATVSETRNKSGKLHSFSDKPSRVTSGGTKFWHDDGELHRDNDLPAVIHSNGTQEWYRNGRLHRDNDQPAFTTVNGTQKWYRWGELRREDEYQPTAVYSSKEAFAHPRGSNFLWRNYIKFL